MPCRLIFLQKQCNLPTNSVLPHIIMKLFTKNLWRLVTFLNFPCCNLDPNGSYSRSPTETLAASGCSSGVEHNLAKVRVEGSNPFARSSFLPSGLSKNPGFVRDFCFSAIGQLFFQRRILPPLSAGLNNFRRFRCGHMRYHRGPLPASGINAITLPNPVKKTAKTLQVCDLPRCILDPNGSYTRSPTESLVASGCSSGVEHNLAKVRVEGSNPFARSSFLPSGLSKNPGFVRDFCFLPTGFAY